MWRLFSISLKIYMTICINGCDKNIIIFSIHDDFEPGQKVSNQIESIGAKTMELNCNTTELNPPSYEDFKHS